MPNVLKVFLENGQTKSFKYDNKTTVKVCNINLIDFYLFRFIKYIYFIRISYIIVSGFIFRMWCNHWRRSWISNAFNILIWCYKTWSLTFLVTWPSSKNTRLLQRWGKRMRCVCNLITCKLNTHYDT